MKTFTQFFEAKENLQNIADKAKIDISKFDPKQVSMGFEVEKEHDGKMGKDTDVVKNDGTILKIAIAHLREDPKYYTKLNKIENT